MLNNNRLRARANTWSARLQKTAVALALAAIFSLSSLALSVALPADHAGHILLSDAAYAKDHGDVDDGTSGVISPCLASTYWCQYEAE